MAVLKHTSPTAEPSAPRPAPSMTVPSASTRTAVASGLAHALRTDDFSSAMRRFQVKAARDLIEAGKEGQGMAGSRPAMTKEGKPGCPLFVIRGLDPRICFDCF